jgi:hypothetical protein
MQIGNAFDEPFNLHTWSDPEARLTGFSDNWRPGMAEPGQLSDKPLGQVPEGSRYRYSLSPESQVAGQVTDNPAFFRRFTAGWLLNDVITSELPTTRELTQSSRHFADSWIG